MIDDRPDLGPDPLAGRDPHPREQIDLWPLHDARQELLEEIVSQPGAGNSAASSNRRFLVPVAIAAAVALVAGGAWFVVAGDDGDQADDQVVASNDAQSPSEDGTDGTTEATDTATPEEPTDEPTAPAEPATIPVSELKKGDVLNPRQCRQLRRGVVVFREGDESQKPRRESWSYILLSDVKEGRVRWIHSIPGEKRQFIGIDKDCTVVSVGRIPKLRVRN